jgi:hypothetical protein
MKDDEFTTLLRLSDSPRRDFSSKALVALEQAFM